MHCPGLWHKRPEAPSLRVVSVRARPPGPVSARADSQSRPGHRGSGPGQKHSVQEPEVERQGEREEVQGKKHGGGGGGAAEGQRARHRAHVQGRADGQVCQTWME